MSASQAGRNVEREHGAAAAFNCLHGCREIARERPVEPGAEHCIDEHIRASAPEAASAENLSIGTPAARQSRSARARRLELLGRYERDHPNARAPRLARGAPARSRRRRCCRRRTRQQPCVPRPACAQHLERCRARARHEFVSCDPVPLDGKRSSSRTWLGAVHGARQALLGGLHGRDYTERPGVSLADPMPELSTAHARATRRRDQTLGRTLGFNKVGIAETELDDDEAHLEHWLAQGRHGEMRYMQRARHANARARPSSCRAPCA